jgi:hypothetical protein
MEIEEIIRKAFHDVLELTGNASTASLTGETVLLQSGLDSLGFAILVARLEEALGYDPFILMTEPVYPRTFSEFVSIYNRYKP